MKTNPGGQIDQKSIIGRDKLIENIWGILQQQSIIITAERRIGKTTVMQKMKAAPQSGWFPVYQDLEKCHTAAEFATAVYSEIDQFLGKKQKVARRSKEFIQAIGGLEVGGVKLPSHAATHWKELLTKSIEDLMQENDQKSKLLFLWDEVPYMLFNIAKWESEKIAMEVLDQLRWLRQTHKDLRMIITGSIGLHHVISSLKENNYANAPTNDMYEMDVPPLSDAHAIQLAKELITGESLTFETLDETSKTIAYEADGFPFYIHHIVKGLKLKERDATPANASLTVQEQLLDANDPWELLHYRERISTYYQNHQKEVILILDELATGKLNASVNELLSMLKGTSTFDDRDSLLHILSLMERDHYLKRNLEGNYEFRFPLIRRWWKINRGL